MKSACPSSRADPILAQTAACVIATYPTDCQKAAFHSLYLGRSNSRVNAHRHFEVDRYDIAQAAIDALARED